MGVAGVHKLDHGRGDLALELVHDHQCRGAVAE